MDFCFARSIFFRITDYRYLNFIGGSDQKFRLHLNFYLIATPKNTDSYLLIQRLEAAGYAAVPVHATHFWKDA
jgi:hypothetical protein